MIQELTNARPRIPRFLFKSVSRPSSTGGAILVVPDGCSKDLIQENLLYNIERHFGDQVASWYHLDRGSSNTRHSIPNGSLKLIITCYQTKLWANAALRSSKYEPDICQAVLEYTKEHDWYQWVPQKGSQICVNNTSYDEVGGVLRTVAVEVCSINYEIEKSSSFLSLGSFSSLPRSPSRMSLRSSSMASSLASRLSRINLSSTFSTHQ